MTGAKVDRLAGAQRRHWRGRFFSDGKRFATGTTKGEVKIWDFATRREVVRNRPGGSATLICLAFSPDGK